MAEPTSTATSVGTAVSIGITALMPGIDGSVLLGAFAGSAVHTLHNKDQSIVRRVVYSAVSAFIGYTGAGDVVQFTYVPIHDATFAAFVLAATVVTLTTTTLDKIKDFDLLQFWKRGG